MGIITRLVKVGVAVTTTVCVSAIAINFMFWIILCLNEES
jgi:hypothetical protein